jgi:hypothetical protein
MIFEDFKKTNSLAQESLFVSFLLRVVEDRKIKLKKRSTASSWLPLIQNQNVPSKTIIEWQRKVFELQEKLEYLCYSPYDYRIELPVKYCV